MRLAVPKTEDNQNVANTLQVREADRKTGALARSVDQSFTNLSLRGKHAFTGADGAFSGSGVSTIITGWSDVQNDGYVSRSSGHFTLLKAGAWSLLAVLYSASNTNGVQHFAVEWDDPDPWSGMGELIDARYRHTGFGGAGYLRQSLSCTTHVSIEMARSGFQLSTIWQASPALLTADLGWRLCLDFLGSTAEDVGNTA